MAANTSLQADGSDGPAHLPGLGASPRPELKRYAANTHEVRHVWPVGNASW